MRQLMILVALLLVCASGVQAQLTSTRHVDTYEIESMSSNDNGLGFGKKIAGTWLGGGSFDLDFNCDGVVDLPLGIPVLDVHTFDAGGSAITTNPANPNSTHGTWIKTGPQQLTAEAIGFGSDSNCTDSDNDGVCEGFGPLVSIVSIRTVIDFDADFETATTSFAATVYPPTEDPLDPAGPPNICTVGSHSTFRKVSVAE